MADVQPTQEQWRPIPGYPSYEASDKGNVRSKDHQSWNGVGWFTKKGRVLKKTINAHGRYVVTVKDESGKRQTLLVHIIVMLAFVGPRPAGMHIAHWDGDRLNNRLDNLRYATPKENSDDKLRHGTSQYHRVALGVHYPARLEVCKRGHVLAAPNLMDTALKKHNRRLCKACRRTHNRVQRNPELRPYFEKIADSYYEQIMK
ncbi:NUMOD4 motif-containing HNH endonuclease [Corynebacterium sanguinis]|uniref:HNH endonuclease n=1 Tax=Corynebacterium sanguinis TaxID=2594913 RepID=A0A6C1TZR2_9CORY|nr:hypothetical protein EKI59_02380 [Corynebacterium sanguinis]